jgi:hypothetical protein
MTFTRSALIAGFALLALNGCGQSDAEYRTYLKTTVINGCTEKMPTVAKLTKESAQTICSCSFNRLIAHYPIKEIRAIDESKNEQAMQKMLVPIVKDCATEEVMRLESK